MKIINIALLFLLVALTGCNPLDAINQRQAAEALLNASEKCVYSVRDQKKKYQNSPSCLSLGGLAGIYINAGGLHDGNDVQARLLYEQARVHAWMALALSETDGKVLKIW